MKNPRQVPPVGHSAFSIQHSALPAVLCYHRIGGPFELGVTRVARSVLERQVTALARAGWRTLTLAQFSDVVWNHSPIPAKSFLLTFDDGYASLAEEAYPVLAEHGFTATTFLITGFTGRDNTWDVRYTWRRLQHLDWPTIERWKARGFDFGSHTVSHRRLTWLTEVEVMHELHDSRETLVSRLGVDAGRALAYPFGAHNECTSRYAFVCDYDLGFCGVRGQPGDMYHLPRTPVYFWDAWNVPFGLRTDGLGAIGREIAHVANRCSVGTSVMNFVRRARVTALLRHPPPSPWHDTPCPRTPSPP